MADKHLELARKVGLPADLLSDTGHPAGLRMRDRGGFNDDWALSEFDLGEQTRIAGDATDIGAFESQTLFADGFED